MFEHLIKAFDRIGATARVTPGSRWTIDVRSLTFAKRRSGSPRSREIFELTIPADVEVQATDVVPRDRHLLLNISLPNEPAPWKVLAGHDERHWFCASIPGRPPSVAEAKQALMPGEVGLEVARRGVKKARAARRRNEAFVRQGEWFFSPMDGWSPGRLPVLKDEPISRGTLRLQASGGAHWCEELVRVGVETFVSVRGHGLVKLEVALEERLEFAPHQWVVPSFCAVRGRVSHRDHATIDLGRIWHRVHMNTESEAPGRRNLLFLD